MLKYLSTPVVMFLSMSILFMLADMSFFGVVMLIVSVAYMIIEQASITSYKEK